MSAWLILSAKHSPAGELAMWWGPGLCGYTPHIAQAGRYRLADALETCFPGHPRIPPSDFAVPLREVGEAETMTWREAREKFTPAGQPMQREVDLAPWEIDDEG